MRRFALTLILIAGFAATERVASSQVLNHPSASTATPTSESSAVVNRQDDPIAKALEQAINRLAVAEEKNRLLEDRLAAKDTQIEAFKGLVAVRDEQITLLRSANQDRTAVNNGDARMLASCELQLSRADAEISRLRNPGFFRSVFDFRSLTGAFIGYGIGRVTK